MGYTLAGTNTQTPLSHGDTVICSTEQQPRTGINPRPPPLTEAITMTAVKTSTCTPEPAPAAKYDFIVVPDETDAEVMQWPVGTALRADASLAIARSAVRCGLA